MSNKEPQHKVRARATGSEPAGKAKTSRGGRASVLPDAADVTAAESSCPIAGIGASAGGLEAFTRLLRALPEHVGMALVLVQHLDPTQESMLADILGRVSTMPVLEAADGMRVESDHIYIMPPNASIRISDGAVRLEKRPKAPTQVLPIDTLLRSLADQYANKAIGVVLSGTGSDGAIGLAAVKAAGGFTLVQEPSTAEYNGMPMAAIQAGVVDAVLDPEHIAGELVRLGQHPGLRESRLPDEAAGAIDEESLGKILSLVREATGLDLTSYRRTTLLRRISRRMLLEGVATMKDYLGALQERPPEVEALYRDILVNMTEFFRDPEALDALKREVFPEVLKRMGSGGSIRIWVPGCAKGQEAYSILITLAELLDGMSLRPEIQMFASDVNEQDVDFARTGVYPQGIVNEVSAERLARFFVQVPGGYQIDRNVREMCVFAVHDITKDPPFSRLDVVSFRNVLIYMERPLQQRVLQILHYALEPGGFLLLGSSETTGTESALFSVVDKKLRVYKRKPGPGKLLSALSPSAGALGFTQRGKAGQQVLAFDILGEAEKVVRGRYRPAGVLVNADLDVLQFRGHIGSYLDPAEGPPELKLPRLVSPGLSLTVEAAIREAAKTSAAVTRRGTVVESQGAGREIQVEAVPIASPTGESYYLVLFEERQKQAPTSGPETKKQAKERVADESEAPVLRRQLDETREQLDSVVSEREAASADLRAASERFQSSNEELRTINEEFQTAQEELQSTNEELTTLNDELRNRNTELGRLADDLNNVIEGVEIPILILDADMRIRRFTPQTEAIVSVVPTDVGRPITDLSMKVGIPDFQDRIREVLHNGVPLGTEVRSGEGRWYSVRIRPYKTGEGRVDGVVIAFIDIDELKKSAGIAETARRHAEAVVATVVQPLLTLTADLHVREANDAFYQTFAVTQEETIGGFVYELGDGQWDFPELRSLLEHVLPGDNDFANLEVERDFPRVGHRIMVLYARRVKEEQGQPSILLAIDDATELRRRERLSTSLNNISATIGSTLELDEVLEQILKESTEVLGAESSAVLIKQGSTHVVKKAYGMSDKVVGRVLPEQELADSITPPWTAPEVLDHVEAERLASTLDIQLLDGGSVLAVPLLLREEPIGWVLFQFRSSNLMLGESETDFARRFGTLMSFTFENARLYATQREIADTLQAALLTAPPLIPGTDFGYLYRSATTSATVGGDFYDMFELEGDRVGIVLGDVSGKGVQAATLTSLVKNTIRALAYEHESPATVLRKTSAVILKATPASIFVTIVLCVLDTVSGRLSYCSAGHTRGIVKRASGDVDLFEVSSPLAGAFPGTKFKDGKTVMEEGDLLVLYTDGVIEARQGEEFFGEERLVEFVRGLEPVRARKVPQAIFDEVLRFAGDNLSDDVAIVSMTRAPKD